MPFKKFSLTLPQSKKPIIFPIPLTNHYQVIDRCTLPEGATELFLDSENKIFVQKKHDSDDFIFYHRPLRIQKKISEVKISQTKQFNYVNDEYINKDDPEILKLASQWLKDCDKKNPNQIVEVLYEKTLTFLSYGNPYRDLYTYTQALHEKVTDCGGFSTVLISLLQSQNIPCRLVVGYLYKLGTSYNLKETMGFAKHFSDISMHAWIEVLEETGAWFPIDPSVDWKKRNNQSEREGGFGIIPADRLVVSFRRNYSISISGKTYQFPLLQHPEILEHRE